MPYTNRCPITYDTLTREHAVLVKVLKKNDKEKDIYYYIGEEDTLKQLPCCPFTARQGAYYVLKLAEQKDISLLQTADANVLIEDNKILARIDQEKTLNWKLGRFEIPVAHQPVPIAMPVVSRQVINDYKANVLRYPMDGVGVPDILNIFLASNRHRFKELLATIAQNSLLNEHDAVFLIKSYILVSEFEAHPAKKLLTNAILGQMMRYLVGALVCSGTLSIIVGLLNNGVSSSTYFGILKILLLDRVQCNFQTLARENHSLKIESILYAVLALPRQVIDPKLMGASALSAVSNGYEFVKTNLSFFHKNYVSKTPTQFELPQDLAAEISIEGVPS